MPRHVNRLAEPDLLTATVEFFLCQLRVTVGDVRQIRQSWTIARISNLLIITKSHVLQALCR